ncbi:MAG TPA: DUF1116 domain-containing protein [Sulfolobales archaeon]|nr:DUF1116 domain-containing protein [Sulfolobales archaeon]
MSREPGRVLNIKEEIERANTTAVERMMESEPHWVDMDIALKVIPGMKDKMLLHAGPPIEYERASGPLRGALIGAVIYEGWASNAEEADRLLRRGDIIIEPTHHHDSVGPMAGVISPSMPVYVLSDLRYGGKAYSNMNEGIGRVLRYGVYDQDVIERLRWMERVLYPVLRDAIRDMVREQGKGLNVKSLIAQALHMGDECHNRHVAATSILIKELATYIFTTGHDRDMVREAYSFIYRNPFTALNIVMAAAKLMTMAAHNIKYSTIVTTMARNGTEFGIRVSGLGDEWFTAPAPIPKGVWFPGYSEKDANPDIGDSAITETAGFGGFAMAAAPAIVSWVGGSVEFAVEITRRMYGITYARHKYFTIPYLDMQGTPVGMDIRKVVATGITPIINTGIAHKEPNRGQIGAGIVTMPIEPFKKALRRFAEVYGI